MTVNGHPKISVLNRNEPGEMIILADQVGTIMYER